MPLAVVASTTTQINDKDISVMGRTSKMKARVAIALAWVLALSGCAATKQVSDNSYQAPSTDYRLIVMEPDVQVAVLTAGGMLEPRQDWTDQARAHVVKALQDQQRS